MKAWIALFLGIFIFLTHWTMTAFHVGPLTPLTEKLIFVNNAYIKPLLVQNWSLFSPDPPTTSLNIAYKCLLDNKKWSELKVPTWDILEKHYKYRIGYYQKLLALINSLAVILNNEKIDKLKKLNCSRSSNTLYDYCPEKVIEMQTPSDIYLLAKRFVKDLCIAEYGKELPTKIFILTQKIKPFSKRKDKNTNQEIFLTEYT